MKEVIIGNKLMVIKGGRREREIRSLRLAYTLPLAQTVKNPPVIQETRVRSLGWEVPLKKEMATHSSILAWGKFHEQRSLVSYSPGGPKELDTTEQLTHIH